MFMNLWINYLQKGPLWKFPQAVEKTTPNGHLYIQLQALTMWDVLELPPWPLKLLRRCPGIDFKMFAPGAHFPQGTPVVQMTHFQFNSHQINVFLTYRKGLNTGLTPGQMPLASKQSREGPPKSMPLVWEKTTQNGIYTFRAVHALMWI